MNSGQRTMTAAGIFPEAIVNLFHESVSDPIGIGLQAFP